MRGPTHLVLMLAFAACSGEIEMLPAEGHVLLHVDTDAPVAPPAGVTRDASAAPPLFDRLLVEVFQPGESEPCAGCGAELDLTEDVLEAGGSFALVPAAPTTGLVVRVRMFLGARRVEDAIAPEASVEVVARLPEVAAEGAVEAGIFLPTDAVGKPIGTLAQPIEAARGPFSLSRVGSWRGAQRVGCAGSGPPGTVCVPGGAFWMGHPLAVGDAVNNAANLQRLVSLQPFFIDDREATVAAFRETGLSTSYVVAWSGKRTGGDNDDLADWCTFTALPDPERDSLPIACISWEGAQAYCQARGGELPTEAQFEYVAGALESRAYVWGSDDPSCDDAIWSRGANLQTKEFVCGGALAAGDIGGPLALPLDAVPESLEAPRARDVVLVSEGALFDLAGNLGEFARDTYQRQDEPCWSRADSNVFYDPLCDMPGVDTGLKSLRGGSWADRAQGLRAASRSNAASSPEFKIIEAGVRCVWPAAPAR